MDDCLDGSLFGRMFVFAGLSVCLDGCLSLPNCLIFGWMHVCLDGCMFV